MAKRASKSAKASAEQAAGPPKTSTTLYCSFCGKNQHEVRKLIAGTTSFICDECVSICVGIVEGEDAAPVTLPSGNRQFVVTLKFEPELSEAEVETFAAFLKTLESAFPGCSVTLRKLMVRESTADLNVVSAPGFEPKVLREELKVLATKLRMTQQTLACEVETRRALEEKARDYQRLISDRAVDEMRSRGDWPGYSKRALLLCFVDVVGFTELGDDDRRRTLELLRHVAAMLAHGGNAVFVNTWGDAVVAAFDDPRAGLECACLFGRHLDLHGLTVRVGVAWGVALVRPNQVIGKNDVEGDCVNVGARLEAVAKPGEVLCTEEVTCLEGVNEESFGFSAVSRVPTKGGSTEPVSAYVVTLKKNAGSLFGSKGSAP